MIIIKNNLLLLRLYIEYNLIWNNIYFLLRKIYIKIIKIIKRKIMIIIKIYWFYIMVWIKKRKRKKRRAFVHHRFNQNKAKMSRHFYTALHFKVLLLFLSFSRYALTKFLTFNFYSKVSSLPSQSFLGFCFILYLLL